MRRIRWRRNLGLPVFPPLQQQGPTVATHMERLCPTHARSPADEPIDRLQAPCRIQKERGHMEEEQCRLGLWRNSEKQRGEDDELSSGKSSIDANVVTNEKWIEYWDEEVEAAYFYKTPIQENQPGLILPIAVNRSSTMIVQIESCRLGNLSYRRLLMRQPRWHNSRNLGAQKGIQQHIRYEYKESTNYNFASLMFSILMI